jgi:Flp pilus assembly protein TadG
MIASTQRTATGKAPAGCSMRGLLARARGCHADTSGAAVGGLSPFRRLIDDTAAVEFALISPVLLAMLLGMFSFGVAMKDYMVLTSAAGQGALTFALSRGTVAPYTKTRAAILAAAPTLTAASISITVKIDNVVCASDAACSTAQVAGKSAAVTAAYPCTLSVMGINYKPGGCTLTASTAQMVQ